MRFPSCAAFGLLSILTAQTCAANGDEPASAPATEETCVTPVGKPPVRCRIRSWQLPGTLEIQTSSVPSQWIESTDVDRVVPDSNCGAGVPPDRRPEISPARATEWIVVLADGSRIVGQVAGGDDTRLLWRHADVGEIALPIDGILRLWKAAGREPPTAGDEDVVELANGDRVRGVVAGVTAGALRLSQGGDERPIPWARLRSVSLAAGKTDSHPGLRAIVELSDDSRLVGRTLEWKKGAIALAFAGATLTIPPASVSDIEIAGGRRDWLSDKSPDSYEATPYLETRWGYQLDRSVLGGPLTMGGAVNCHGIGLHSACRATWRLGGAYERFTALVGIDDSARTDPTAGSNADADVRILLDGKELAAHRGLHCGEPPQAIDLNIAGGDRLTIEVGFGQRGDVQDRVDIVNPALIRK